MKNSNGRRNMSSINEQNSTPELPSRRLTWFEQNPKKTILGILVLLAAVFDLVLGTIFLPSSAIEPSYYYHHGLKSNYKGRIDWGGQKNYMYTDSLGFKYSSRHQISLDSEKRRILVIGDSFVEGVGVPYNKTFVGLVSNHVDSNKFEVINAGTTSFSPKLYYLRTKYLLDVKGLHFNDLYVFIDISDIEDEITYKSYKSLTVPDKEYVIKVTDAWLKSHSAAYAYALRKKLLYAIYSQSSSDAIPGFSPGYYEERSLWTIDDNVYQKWGAEGVALALENMEKLYQLAREHAITLHIAVYPWPMQIQKNDLHSRQVKIWQKFSEERGLDFINYFPDFIDKNKQANDIIQKYFIPGDVHWNEVGHEVVAEKLIANINKK